MCKVYFQGRPLKDHHGVVTHVVFTAYTLDWCAIVRQESPGLAPPSPWDKTPMTSNFVWSPLPNSQCNTLEVYYCVQVREETAQQLMNRQNVGQRQVHDEQVNGLRYVTQGGSGGGSSSSAGRGARWM